MTLLPTETVARLESSEQIFEVRQFPQMQHSQYRQTQQSSYCKKKEPIPICRSRVHGNAKSRCNSRCKNKGDAAS